MSEDKVLKIGILKNGTIGSSLLLAFLMDERAEATRINVYEVTSGAKMHPPEFCTETMKDLLKWEPELILCITALNKFIKARAKNEIWGFGDLGIRGFGDSGI